MTKFERNEAQEKSDCRVVTHVFVWEVALNCSSSFVNVFLKIYIKVRRRRSYGSYMKEAQKVWPGDMFRPCSMSVTGSLFRVANCLM